HGGGERIFQAWPVLLALAPFVALAAAGATAVPLRRLAFGCVVAAIPIYAGMTALHAGDGAAAALWPVRVWTDFIGTSERLALIRTVTTVRPGIPVRIGEHWYRFEHPGTQNAWPVNIRRPDRIAYLQLDIPAEDADLSELRNVGDRIQVNFLSTAPLPWGAS